MCLIYFLKTNTSFLSPNTPENIAVDVIPTSFVLKPIKFTETTLQVNKDWQKGALAKSRKLLMPQGVEAKVFYAGLDDSRGMDFDEQGNLYVAERGKNRVLRLTDTDSDGIADLKIVVAKNIQAPHSVEYFQGDLYVGAQNQVVVFKGLNQQAQYTSKTILVDNLPFDGHSTKTVVIGPDQRMYLAMGSSCNLCEETDPIRAAISRYNLDGTGHEIYASGLRNSVGMVFHLNDDTLQYELWTVDNGRDKIGDDIPPEEVNIIQSGKNYGWPYCYGNQIPNPEFSDKSEYCKQQTELPTYNMQAHSAPLGIAFIPENSPFYQYLGDKPVITLHGSWNRTQKTGYKVVFVDPKHPGSKEHDLISGWLNGNISWGRPVDVKFDSNGAMYVSDDEIGVIYRIY